MTRGTIIMAVVEGIIRDVLTYDAGAHHPRPGRRAKHMRSASSRQHSSPPLGRHDPKNFYPRVTSSAARKPGSTPRGKSKMGKRLAMAAAPYAAFAAFKGYKAIRDRVGVQKMLRKAKKQDSRKKLKEAIVEAVVTMRVYNNRFLSKKPQSTASQMHFTNDPKLKGPLSKDPKKPYGTFQMERNIPQLRKRFRAAVATDPKGKVWKNMSKMHGFDPKAKSVKLKRRLTHRFRKDSNKYKVMK